MPEHDLGTPGPARPSSRSYDGRRGHGDDIDMTEVGDSWTPDISAIADDPAAHVEVAPSAAEYRAAIRAATRRHRAEAQDLRVIADAVRAGAAAEVDRADRNTRRSGSIRLAAFDDFGQPLEIWPCRSCSTWHLEVIRDGPDIAVREWHAPDCPHYLVIICEHGDD